MTASGDGGWTPIQSQAIRFAFDRLEKSPHSSAAVGELAFDYAKSLPSGHSRKCHNARKEPKAMQDIRNIVSNASEPLSPVRLGFFAYDPEGHRLALTELGRKKWEAFKKKE